MTVGYSTRTPQQALAALLDRYAPERLLLIGAQAFPALQAFQDAHPQTEVALAEPGTLPAHLAAQRFDLALVVDCLEHIPKRTGLELLGGIRNLNAAASRCWPICRPAAGRRPTFSRWPCNPANASRAMIRC